MQVQKNRKIYQTELNSTKPLLLTKTENQRLNWRKPANCTRHQFRKTVAFNFENQKTEPNIGQSAKREIPNDHLLQLIGRLNTSSHGNRTRRKTCHSTLESQLILLQFYKELMRLKWTELGQAKDFMEILNYCTVNTLKCS